MVATRLMTATELLNLPEDDASFELFEGEPVPMSPVGTAHIIVVSRLNSALAAYLSAHTTIGSLWGGDAGIRFRRTPDTVLAPDLSVVPEDQIRRLSLTDQGFPDVVPLLIIEVKSPSDREADIARKLAVYLDAGVALVWWVRPDSKLVTEHRPDIAPRAIDMGGALTCDDVLPGFRLDLADLFRG